MKKKKEKKNREQKEREVESSNYEKYPRFLVLKVRR